MKTLTTSCILLFLFPYTQSHIFALVKDYLEWHNIKVVLFLTCNRSDWTERNKIENLKIDDILMSFWDISKETNLSNFNYEYFFFRSSYPFCVVVNWECNQIDNVLSEISRRTMFHYERYWLMFGTNADEMFKVLSGEYINVDAEVAMVAPISKTEYGIDEIYNPSVKRHGRFRIDKVGTWNVNSGLHMNEIQTKYDRRHNLDGISFMAAIAIPKLPPNKTFIEHIDADEILYMDNLSKSDYRVFQIFQQMFNFRMTVIRVRRWGGVTPNGTWLGLVGLLNRSEVDLSITGLRWEGDRYGVLDQTTESFYVQILFIFRHPKIVDAARVFLSPFDMSVWVLIVSLGSITSILIRRSFQLENIMNKSLIESTANESSYDNSFLMIFGALIQQGYSGDPVFVSSRIAFLTISMFSIMMFQFYGSFILGSLLTEPPKTIKTMKQLLKTDLDFAMDEIPYIQDTFLHIREKSAVEMYNKIMAQPKPILSLFTGLDLVKKGTMAFNTDGIYAYALLKTLLTDNELCDLQEVKYVGEIPTGPGLPKKSPLRELIKIGIRKVRETGVLGHVWKTWIARIPECERSDVEVVPVDVIHFSSALYVLGFGIQMSCIIFFCELFIIYCSKWRFSQIIGTF